MAELNHLLRNSEEARTCFRAESEMHGLIQAAATTLVIDETQGPTRLHSPSFNRPQVAFKLSWQTLATTAAGLFMGAFFMSVAWAITSPRMIANIERLLSFANGSFEDRLGRLPDGFPTATGVWGGDHAVVVSAETVGLRKSGLNDNHLLRFVEPGSDAGASDAQAISCDVFQLVDLRALRSQWNDEQELSLELSASFLDARVGVGSPVTFFCQMFLFAGDPEQMHTTWPSTLEDAVASSKSLHHTHGGLSTQSPKRLTARCLIPQQADFAVIQVAARPDRRPAVLDSLYVDDVTLTLKSQPSLPVRIVQPK
jgi:hypothetical protein